MRANFSLSYAIGIVAICTMSVGQLLAAPVTFFGEDHNIAVNHINAIISNAARDSFFMNLSNPFGMATETFEEFKVATSLPITVGPFSGAGSALLLGNAYIASGSDKPFVGFPISGTKYLSTPVIVDFNTKERFKLFFSSPISAFGFYLTNVGACFDCGQAVLTLGNEVSGKISTLTIPNTIGSSGNSVLYYGFYDLSDTYSYISFGNTSEGAAFGFDDFSFGLKPEVTPTIPELSTYVLTGGGVLLAALLRRKLGV